MRPLLGALAALFWGWSPTAFAHSPMPGFEGFYVGVLHPLAVPGQLLTLVAGGLLLGRQGPPVARPAFAAFLAALVAGVAAGGLPPADAFVSWAPLAAALPLALLLLIPHGGVVTILAAAVAGGVVGLGLNPDPGPFGAVAITVAGSLVGAPFLLLCAFGAADVLRERLPAVWSRNVLRVAGAWLFALAALLLALELRAV
jgi:hypothetical protein